MRITIHKPRNQGSTLATTLVVCMVIGIMMTSYLGWISSRSKIAMRSLAWNDAMPVLEAGLEEALAQLHDYSDNLTTNGWKLVKINGKDCYQKRRDFTNDGSFYIVTISNSAWAPIVYSQGFVPAPYKAGYISRMVKITATNTPTFFAGIVCKQYIQMSGNGLTVDSYNSTVSGRNCSGGWCLTARGDEGNIATVSGLLNAFNVGNADIYGKIGTGPGGSYSIGGGCVGDLAYHVPLNDGKVQPGWYSDDFNYNFPPINAPSNNLVKATSGSFGSKTYSILLDKSTNYWVDDFTGDFCIKPNIKATLSVYKSLNVTGQGQISFNNGATVKLYVYCDSATLGGQSVANQNGAPQAFQYYGMPSNKTLSFKGGSAVTACIYAPDADLGMSGGGNSPMDFSGSSITKTITMTGNWNVHYDESLGTDLPNGFVVTSWTEL